jgi:hypothetical protein
MSDIERLRDDYSKLSFLFKTGRISEDTFYTKLNSIRKELIKMIGSDLNYNPVSVSGAIRFCSN